MAELHTDSLFQNRLRSDSIAVKALRCRALLAIPFFLIWWAKGVLLVMALFLLSGVLPVVAQGLISPKCLKDQNSKEIFYVESDGIHVAALNEEGKIL
jgi:hypothetical protein